MITGNDLLPPEIAESETDSYVAAITQFEEAARDLQLEPWIRDRLKNAEREVRVQLSYVGAGGERKLFEGYRVLHSSARGPGLGPLFLTRDSSLNRVRAAALKATWQSALFDVPFGGSAGALVCAPEDLSEVELRWIVQAYIEKMGGMVSRFSDVVIPQCGSSCRLATWMMDACGRHAGLPDFAAVTGKPSAVWGLANNGGAASGLKILLEEIMREGGAALNHQTVVVQGFGNLGAAIVRELDGAEARVVGVADISGALYHAEGIDVPQLQEYFQQQKMLYGYPDADVVCNADLLEAPADVLILAAVGNQITRTNAEHIRARIVVEVAENAVSAGGEEMLKDRGIVVIPEFLANGGGLVSAFLEWSQGLRFCRFSAEVIQQTLRSRIANCWRELSKNPGDVRRAALQVAIGRVAETLRVSA